MNTLMGFDLGFTPLEWDRATAAFKPAEARLQSSDALPEKLRWRSGAVMTRLDPAWRVIYARGGEAVLIERAYGRGSVVVASDSFFASNEALRDERQATLLAWLIGPSRRVIFDETHLGMSESQGMMTLALKYRLHGVLGVIVLLGLLFVWKNASRLVPPGAGLATADARAESGRDAWAGMVDLLRRNIGRGQILRVCLAEWAKTRAGAPGSRELEKKMSEELERREALPLTQRNLGESYRAMAEIAGKKRETRR